MLALSTDGFDVAQLALHRLHPSRAASISQTCAGPALAKHPRSVMRVKTEIIKLATLRVPRPSPFGEYLVQQRVLDRFQLFRVLQQQDRMPGAKLGACAVALGFASLAQIEALYQQFCQEPGGPDLESMITESFHREPELEIIYAPHDTETIG